MENQALMENQKLLIFDLDGTLIHSGALVLPAFHQAIEQLPHHKLPDEATMLSTFGLPDHEIWEVLLPRASAEERLYAHQLCDDYVQAGLQDRDIMFPHAREVLTELKQRGHILTTASNCGNTYLNDVLDSQKIRSLFTHPECLESVDGRVKADILTAHFARFDKTNAVMIGDRSSDLEAARVHGIPTVGCEFGAGFAAQGELQGATYVIHSLPELLDLF
jgi:phosphoglycolate phosphatase